jgi:hypothetical protein
MKIAICISGQPRYANFGSYHQKKFADALPYDVDFYVQSWSQDGVEDNQDKLFGYCEPKRVRIDSGYVPPQYPGHFHKLRGLSQHYAHYLCMSQIPNIDEYDLIIRTRHDTMFNTDVMEYQIDLLEYVNRNKSVSGAGYYPDYSDHPVVSTYVDQPSHRGFSKYPSFDDWSIIAHRDHWSKYRIPENEFLDLLDEMFLDPRNDHNSATYDLEGTTKKVCVPELVWYNLTNLDMKYPFTVAKGFVYIARPNLKEIIRHDHVSSYTPTDLRLALQTGWQNGSAVLQYSILL